MKRGKTKKKKIYFAFFSLVLSFFFYFSMIFSLAHIGGDINRARSEIAQIETRLAQKEEDYYQSIQFVEKDGYQLIASLPTTYASLDDGVRLAYAGQ